jgi:two-component system LytT family response regulator
MNSPRLLIGQVMILKSIIVDDEPLARKGLAVRLAEFQDIEVVVQCCNGREALEQIKVLSPDLMFLDIQMPGLSGFDVIESIIKEGLKMPAVVFVTAFDKYALKAFEVHALDYILKPADEQRLEQTIDKIRSHFRNNLDNEQKTKLIRLVSDVTGNDYQQILFDLDNNQELIVSTYSDILAIKDGGEVSRVPVKDILWVDAAGDYMCVHVIDNNKNKENTHILRKTMKELEVCLDPKQFIRNHRSTIVNKHYIDKFYSQMNGEYYLVLQNGKELKVSRSYKDKVKQAVNN